MTHPIVQEIEKALSGEGFVVHALLSRASAAIQALQRKVTGLQATLDRLAELEAQVNPEPAETDDMCPNCVTPWKCNGPHIPFPIVPAPVETTPVEGASDEYDALHYLWCARRLSATDECDCGAPEKFRPAPVGTARDSTNGARPPSGGVTPPLTAPSGEAATSVPTVETTCGHAEHGTFSSGWYEHRRGLIERAHGLSRWEPCPVSTGKVNET